MEALGWRDLESTFCRSKQNRMGEKVLAGFWAESSGSRDLGSESRYPDLIGELATAAECKLISYDPESYRLVGESVNVSVD